MATARMADEWWGNLADADRRAADRAQDRRRLRGHLLAHHDSEARGDLRNQPRGHWRRKDAASPVPEPQPPMATLNSFLARRGK